MDNLKDRFGYLLNTSSRLLTWEFNNKLKGYGLTSTQWAVIKDLHEQLLNNTDIDNLTPAAISTRLQYDRPTISGVIDRLIDQQFVLRSPNPLDRRSQILHLTTKANDLLYQIDTLSLEVVDSALADFKEEEITQLKTFLKRITNNLSVGR